MYEATEIKFDNLLTFQQIWKQLQYCFVLHLLQDFKHVFSPLLVNQNFRISILESLGPDTPVILNIRWRRDMRLLSFPQEQLLFAKSLVRFVEKRPSVETA